MHSINEGRLKQIDLNNMLNYRNSNAKNTDIASSDIDFLFVVKNLLLSKIHTPITPAKKLGQKNSTCYLQSFKYGVFSD